MPICTPAVRQHVHRRQLLGEHDRVLVVVVVDERTEPQRRGGVGRALQRRHRRQLIVEVVGHAERRVPEPSTLSRERRPTRRGRPLDLAWIAEPERTDRHRHRTASRQTVDRRCRTATGATPGSSVVSSALMSRLSWVLRMALVIGAGALLLTAVTVAVAPRMWRIANAHEEIPVELPDFAPLAQRSYVYDAAGQRDRACSRSRTASRSRSTQVPRARDRRLPRRRGQRVLRPPRRQRAQPVPGDAVELRLRRTGAGRLDDHDAGRQERLPGRASSATAATSCCR